MTMIIDFIPDAFKEVDPSTLKEGDTYIILNTTEDNQRLTLRVCSEEDVEFYREDYTSIYKKIFEGQIKFYAIPKSVPKGTPENPVFIKATYVEYNYGFGSYLTETGILFNTGDFWYYPFKKDSSLTSPKYDDVDILSYTQLFLTENPDATH